VSIDLDILPALPTVNGPYCGVCPNQMNGIRMIPPDGQGYSGVMIVGDSGWEWEAKEGRVFAGPAGQFLEKHIFRRLGVQRNAFTLTNTTWCKAPYLNFYDKAGPEATVIIEHCRPYLDELIDKVKPKVIVPMGNVALRRVCGVNGIQAHQCYVHDTPYGIPAVPTYHPSYLMQDNLAFTPVALFAMRRALEIAKAGRFERILTDYCLDPSLPDLKQWMARYGHSFDLTHAVDIENPWGKLEDRDKDDPHKGSGWEITRCGFSFNRELETTGKISCGLAASYPWAEPFISFTRELLARAKRVVYQNANHDRPRLDAAECPTLGAVDDTMWCFHYLQSDLPKGLKFFAPFYTDMPEWASQKDAQPAWYNACDNDATLRSFFGMRDWLIRQGRWERFKRHCSDTAALLGEMSSAGVLVDVAARQTLQDGLRSEIAQLDSQIQAAVPRELLPVKELKTDRTLKELPDEERADWEPVQVVCECKRVRKATGRCLLCDDTRSVTHYRKRLAFNWNSTDQVQDLARHFKFTIPKKRGEDREALEAKTLKSFGKKKRVFADILAARQRHKLVSTYNWECDSEGRVHTKFGFHPSNWRKSSRDPNLQNIPKRNELAAAFRRTIIAAPGHVLIEADSSAIEAVLVGYCAQSPRYIKIAQAGIHGFVTSHRLALRDGGRGIDPNLPFDELTKQCKKVKKDFPNDYENAKRGDHAVNYMLSAFGLNDEAPDEFPTKKLAQDFIDFYFSLFPELPPWQRNTIKQADMQTFLDNHFQYRHYFFACTKWNSKYQKWDLGSDAKRAVSFVPSSDASAIQSEDLLTLAEIPDIRRMLRLIVHDSHILECPINDVEYVCPILHSTMSRPRPELGGLEIGVEIKYGPNLQDTQLWVPPSIN